MESVRLLARVCSAIWFAAREWRAIHPHGRGVLVCCTRQLVRELRRSSRDWYKLVRQRQTPQLVPAHVSNKN